MVVGVSFESKCKPRNCYNLNLELNYFALCDQCMCDSFLCVYMNDLVHFYLFVLLMKVAV